MSCHGYFNVGYLAGSAPQKSFGRRRFQTMSLNTNLSLFDTYACDETGWVRAAEPWAGKLQNASPEMRIKK